MRVDTKDINPAFLDIIRNPAQRIFLDANFFIPPDRSKVAKVKSYSFEDFKEKWLVPLLSEFTNLSIHESVYDELVEEKVKYFATKQTDMTSPRLEIHYDSE